MNSLSIPSAGESGLVRRISKGRLKGSKGSGPHVIDFQYNPTEISLSHNAEGHADPVNKGDNEGRSIIESLATRGSTRLILSSLTFTGDRCQSIVDILIEWVTPLQEGANQKPRREPLTFEWGVKGAGFHYQVELMRFDCTYTRFTRAGEPIRAEIRNLTLHVLPSSQDSPRAGAHGASGATPANGSWTQATSPGMDGPNTDRIRAGLKTGK
ncbi:hypothetical protein ABZ069_37045 [Streptomyces microflavus]|uniref:CIS tube protein n=1 Tax=Streptomyces microflavus TaxID=1919 RepID=UPI0033A6AF44